MRRRLFTSLLLAMLLALPQAAWAQEPVEPEGGTDTTTEEPADALATFASWISAVAEAFGVDLDAADATVTPPDDVDPAELEAARAAFSEVLDAALQGLAVQFMVAEATADAATMTDDEGGEPEPVEEDTEATSEDESEDASEDESEGAHGEIVRTVAHCAPRGFTAKGWLDGVRNHGQFVSTAARGGTVELAVPVIVEGEDGPELTGESEQVSITLDSVEGAEQLCAAIATIEDAKALAAALEGASEEEAETADEDRRRPDRTDREERKAERKAERDERKAEREADREERRAEQQQRKAERRQGRGD